MDCDLCRTQKLTVIGVLIDHDRMCKDGKINHLVLYALDQTNPKGDLYDSERIVANCIR